jgi:hypothetical protein
LVRQKLKFLNNSAENSINMKKEEVSAAFLCARPPVLRAGRCWRTFGTIINRAALLRLTRLP